MPHSIRTKENSAPAALGPRGAAGLLLLLLLSLAANAKAGKFGDFSYTSDGSTVIITRYSGSEAGVTIPGKIGDLPVTSIGTEAFFGCTGLTSIIIPGSVTSISSYAFSSCEICKMLFSKETRLTWDLIHFPWQPKISRS